MITTAKPLCEVLRYAQLGVAVSNIATSVAFYEKIGFQMLATHENVTVLRNRGGLELHMCLCDKPLDDGKNLLMDFPASKYPGHTHAAFSVPSVPAAVTYLQSQGIAISGERPGKDRIASVFTRDPDFTTYEYERNDGPDDDVEMTADMIGYPQCLDHVGIRVSNPEERWLWYAEKLGFVNAVSKLELHSEPLQNRHPWISRTLTNVDINFLVNANESLPGNRLFQDGLRPGIIFISFAVASVSEAEARLKEHGVPTFRDSELHLSPFSSLANRITPGQLESIFIHDGDFNLIRLVNDA